MCSAIVLQCEICTRQIPKDYVILLTLEMPVFYKHQNQMINTESAMRRHFTKSQIQDKKYRNISSM